MFATNKISYPNCGMIIIETMLIMFVFEYIFFIFLFFEFINSFYQIYNNLIKNL